ncbi:MAG: hypothetical protein WAR81_17405 [Pseudomonadales bacterium]
MLNVGDEQVESGGDFLPMGEKVCDFHTHMLFSAACQLRRQQRILLPINLKHRGKCLSAPPGCHCS